MSDNLKLHLDGVEEILALNNHINIKLWLKERIYSIEVFNKSGVVIKYRLPW